MPKATVLTIPEHSLKLDNPPRSQKRIRRSNQLLTRLKLWLVREVGSNITLLLLGFLLGRVIIMNELAPFGFAYFSAILLSVRQRALLTSITVILGILSTGFYLEAGIYVVSMLLMLRLVKYEVQQKIPGILLAFLVIWTVGTIAALMQPSPLYSAILAVINAVMCSILMFVFKSGISLLTNKHEVNVSIEATIFLVVLLAAAVAGMGNLLIFDYSVRSIAGNFLVLNLAYLSGAGAGAALGVGIGLVIGLTGSADPALTVMMYALSGLLGGFCRLLGRLGVILGFAFGAVTTVFYMNQAYLLPNLVAELSMAAGFFLMVASDRMAKWRSLLVQVSGKSVYQEFMLPAAEKLTGIAGIFGDLAKMLEASSNLSTQKMREKNLSKMLTTVGECFCETCSKKSECWERHYTVTYEAMLNVYYEAEAGRLTRRTLPKALKENCVRYKEVLDKALSTVECRGVQNGWHQEAAASREMVYEQVRAMEDIVGSLALEMKREPVDDYELAQSIKDKATLLNCPLASVRVSRDNSQKALEITKSPCEGTKECQHTVLPLAANIMKEKLHMRAVCGNKLKECHLYMETVNRYNIEVGVACQGKNRGTISGDSYAIIPSRKGKVAVILSDGMGSGREAELESRTTVNYLKKLLEMGFDIDASVKTVNAMLLLTTQGDNFATMDMVVIDQFTGVADFYKIGAAPSFIKRICEVSTIDASSLPIGILTHIETEQVCRQMAAGDMIVVVSDGIAEAAQYQGRGEQKECWLANYLRQTQAQSAQELADKIIAAAIDKSGAVADDMTVIVAKVEEVNQ